MPQTIRFLRTFLFLSGTLALLGTPGQSVTSQRTASAALPDFFVKIDNQKASYYQDESIQVSISRRQGKPESPGCSFGGQGTLQILKNGEVVKEERTGPISMLSSANFGGVRYSGFGMGTSPSYFVHDPEINIKDSYQIRVTCGQEVSAPSKPFHVDPWLEPVDGLQVFIRRQKQTYQVGEPIMIEATMRNVGTRPWRCPVPRADDGRQYGYWTPAPPYWEDPRPTLDHDNWYRQRLGVLNPGQSRTATIPLSIFRAPGLAGKPMFGSRPGKFQIWFTVFFHQEDEDIPPMYRKNIWRGEMATNTIEIVVR